MLKQIAYNIENYLYKDCLDLLRDKISYSRKNISEDIEKISIERSL